jgi:hypothetical protein
MEVDLDEKIYCYPKVLINDQKMIGGWYAFSCFT